MQLGAVVGDVVAYQRASARVEVLEPPQGQWVPTTQPMVPVRVKVHGFEIPGDGSWCLFVNGSQVCEGGVCGGGLDGV